MTINIDELSDMIDSMSITHQGQTLTAENATIAGLAYLIDMGLKQSLGDLQTTSRPPITGFKKDGSPCDTAWKPTKRQSEARRLGFADWQDTPENREALATVWIDDAIATKFAAILSGELTVSASGVRGDAVTRLTRELIETAILNNTREENKTRKVKLPVPKGDVLKAMIDENMATPDIAAYFRDLAEKRLAEESGMATAAAALLKR